MRISLIAIMLGYMRLSIDECLTHYEELAEKIFVSRMRSGKPWKWAVAEAGTAWYSGEDLKNQVKILLRKKGMDPEVAFKRDGEQGCKV
jgi:hypothetical protein